MECDNACSGKNQSISENKDVHESSESSNIQRSFQSMHVSIKTPEFMPESVDAWFMILESQFHLRGVTSEVTRFYHALSALPANVIGQISSDILEERSFESLKNSIKHLHQRSKAELFNQLMASAVMSGKPSAYAVELLGIARKVGGSEELVRHKFIQALPVSIRPVLMTQSDLSLTRLAQLADELVPMAVAPCFAVTSKDPESSFSFERNVPLPPRHRCGAASSAGIPIGLRPYNPSQRPRVCRAHIYFGMSARTCKPWCRWPKKRQDLQMQPSSRSSSPARADPEN